jgi:hypothetical protein
MSGGFNPETWAGSDIATKGGGRADIQWFNLNDGESADVRILTPNPKQMWVHRIVVNGKRYPAVCLGFKECPAPHEKGKNAAPRYALTVIDRRDKAAKIWEMNHRTFKVLLTIVAKKGDPTGYDLNVSRVGKSTDTQYPIMMGDSTVPLSDGEKAVVQPNLEEYYKANKTRMEALLRGEVPKRKENEEQNGAAEESA